MKRIILIFGIVILTTGNIMATQYDVGVSVLDMTISYLSDVDYIVVSGKVKNYGTQTINSYKVHYQINNGDVFDYYISGTVIIQDAERVFEHPEPIDPQVGKYTIKVWTSLPNGQEDENPANDAITFNFEVYDVNTYIPRTILVEGYTSSSCFPCVDGNANLKARLLENTGLYALIKYQMSWPGNGDPYYTVEGGARRTYYGINSVPWVQIEGSGWGGSSYSVVPSFLTDFQAIQASLYLYVDFYVEGHTLYAKTKIISPVDISNTNLKLYLAIVEKMTYANWITIPDQSNGEREFQQVLKKFMPDANGIVLNGIKANVPHIILQEWEFKGNYKRPNNALTPINHSIEHSVEDFGNLTIVAWVQNNQNKSVAQAANGNDTEAPILTFSVLNNEFGKVSATIGGNPVYNGDIITKGETVVLSAIPNNGYEAKEWKVNGVKFAGENLNSIEVTSEGYTDVMVEFKKSAEYPCNTVGANAKSEIEDDCSKATIIWSAAEGEYTKGYRILFNGNVLEDNIQTTEYVHIFDFEHGKTYNWEIVTICEYGVSESRTVTAIANCDAGVNRLLYNLSIYPNPSSTSVIIEGAEIEKVEIFNMLGYHIDTKEGCVNSIDVSVYKKGQYVFKIYGVDGYFVNKLISIN